ncbi:uncharacterized protein LOC132864618 isoform X1 [Neoarius graeffei]|uniref:uncharacterized protein LOC132864618 isoform X1 n=1 Tax=Neoarius graeffei TaxID=443677 RepID=UPI00298CEFA4|nr:uncharacterized protein LOC132864618 isoform X1 [Neoarius graeffei]XP_060754020.1 uncharacterized protein LOC132864618 isoform X1 [Neoarius graeffei]
MKRERKRVLEEALSGVQTDQASPHQSESEHEPGCSSWIEQPDTSRQSSQSAGTQTWVPTSSTGTQTCRSATSYAKRIQVSVQTRDAWTQYIALDVTGRSRGSFCDLSEEEEDQMDFEEAREEEKGAISSDFTPGGDSDPESSDSQSTPERPTQRLRKLQGGRAPSVEVRHNRLIPPHEDTKYIVFETKLLDLFKLCRDCRSGNVCISKRLMGTLLIITVECYSCTSTNKWESQPFYQSRPAGNLLLCAATLFAGGSWMMMWRILSHLRLVCIADQTFYTIQRDILQPAIECRWSEEQQRVVGQLQSTGTPLVIASDGRADSPGHSAKFGVYTGLEATLNKIVDLELVQLEGFKRLQGFLSHHGLQIGKLITDRHRQLAKHVRENLPHVLHTYDVWHIAKAVQKKVHALAKQKNCDDLLGWEKSINNHVYWVASSTRDQEEELRGAKWNSLGNHIQGIHCGHSAIFPTCLHGDLQEERAKNWLKPGTKVAEKFDDIINNTTLVKDIKKMSSGHQTSLESFHSVINQFAPKMKSYRYHGILSRIHLAALHYNANSDRQQARTSKGDCSEDCVWVEHRGRQDRDQV